MFTIFIIELEAESLWGTVCTSWDCRDRNEGQQVSTNFYFRTKDLRETKKKRRKRERVIVKCLLCATATYNMMYPVQVVDIE